MDRKEATKVIKRIYRAIEENMIRVHIKRMGDTMGWCRYEDDHIDIILNPDDRAMKSCLLSTFIHECIHMLWNDLTEKQVLKMENEVFEALSDRQLENLFKRLTWRIGKGKTIRKKSQDNLI
jgi:hypothetical protein